MLPILIASLVQALTCPHPVEMLGDKASPGFQYQISNKDGNVRTVRVSRLNRTDGGITIKVDKKTVANPTSTDLLVFPLDQQLLSDCNGFSSKQDMSYARDAILSLYLSHCLAGRSFFTTFRFEPPSRAENLRASLRNQLRSRCPAAESELNLLDEVIRQSNRKAGWRVGLIRNLRWLRARFASQAPDIGSPWQPKLFTELLSTPGHQRC